jgi:arylsulfatase A-like enzyme
VGEKTAAQWLMDAGYVTGHIGKWHLGNPKIPEFNPAARGFVETIWFPGQKKLPPLDFVHNGVSGQVGDRYVDEAIAREATEFVNHHRAEPWFLYVAFLTPHQPLDTPPGTEEPFSQITNSERRKCAAMISLLDESVGRVLKALRDSGQEERTLIIFHSDNGAPPKNGSRNTPLRGGKGTTWEGGIREPFVMQWKGTLPAGRVEDTPIISLDMLPTALAAAGVNVPTSAGLDGVNLLPFLTGKKTQAPHEALFWRYGEQSAVRASDWKLTRALDTSATPPVLKAGLYDLANDQSEQHDLSSTHHAKLVQLQKLWDEWDAGNVPALWSSDSHDGEGEPIKKPNQ